MNITLTINPRFESVIPPMTTAELVLLEDNILTDGRVLMPIVVWNGTIIDGHKRFKIVGKHPEIEYSITELFFDDSSEYDHKHLVGRLAFTDPYRIVLIARDPVDRDMGKKKAVAYILSLYNAEKSENLLPFKF